MNDIEQRISQILIRHFGVEQSQIVPTADFRSDMSADSLDLLDLTLSIEDAFSIEIADDVAVDLHTVGDLVAFVRSQRPVLQAAA